MSNIFHLFSKFITNKQAEPVSFLVAGLGNPGPKYQGTRHNVGFDAVDFFAKSCNAAIEQHKFHSLVGEVFLQGKRGLLLKPLTFMNESGVAVEEARKFYKLETSDIIVIADDIFLPAGRIRIRRKGSAGGHNGLKSIIYSMGEDTFLRVKIGVGNKPSANYDLARWVLSKFSSEQQEKVNESFYMVVQALNDIIAGKCDQAMNKFN